MAHVFLDEFTVNMWLKVHYFRKINSNWEMRASNRNQGLVPSIFSDLFDTYCINTLRDDKNKLELLYVIFNFLTETL